MNTPIFLVLATIILGALVADTMMYGNEHLIFLGKEMLDLIEWIAFWR